MLRSATAKHKRVTRHQKLKKQHQAQETNGQDTTKSRRVTSHPVEHSAADADDDKDDDSVISESALETVHDDSARTPSSSSSPLAMTDVCDLPIRVFVGTYTGTLYGLETVDTIRQMNIAHSSKTQMDTSTTAETSPQHTTSSEDEEEAESQEEEEEEEEEEQDEENHLADDNIHSDASVIPFISASSSSSVSVPTFLTLFSTDAHRSAIHALAASPDGRWLISSGPDEIIQLYSLSTLQHHGSLHRHHSTITGLAFATPAVFCSTSEDGSIGIWSALHQWEMIASLRAHTGSVISMSIHASAKVMLTVSKDHTVRMWDLVTGTLATTRHLTAEDTRVIEGGHGHIYSHPILISWCHADPSEPADPHHLHYCLLHDFSLHLYNEQGLLYRKILNTASPHNKMTTCCFFQDIVFIGYDHGLLSVYRVNDGVELLSIAEYHHARIRCMEMMQRRRRTAAVSSIDGEENDEQLLTFVCTADTQGQIHLWNVTELLRIVARAAEGGEGKKSAVPTLPAGVLLPVASAKSDERITALTITHRWETDLPPSSILTLIAEASTIQPDQHMDPSRTSSRANGDHHQASLPVEIPPQNSSAKTTRKQKTKNPNKAQRKKQKRLLAEAQQLQPRRERKTAAQADANKRKTAASASNAQKNVVIVNKKRRVQQ